MSSVKKVSLILFLISTFYLAEGQQTPLNHLSYWVFTPYIYNPGIIGSKDYLSVDFSASFQGKSNTQIISGNTRFSRTKSGYFSSPDIVEFKNYGIGWSVFNDVNDLSRNTGASLSGSYQIPINTRKLSFLSFGVSVKGVYNILDTASVIPENPTKKSFYPNLDLGIYYYGTNFYSGISTTNMLGNPEKKDSLALFRIPVSRQYFFTAGYKIIFNRSLNIVLEPSVLIFADDSTFNKIADNINPVLKLYAGNFCVGTYFLSDGRTSFFGQFRYPRFYVGTFFELPRKTPYFRRIPLVEFTLGINIQIDKSRLSNHSHW
jgi:type IX secretion system PorP/SprF family membrane protein